MPRILLVGLETVSGKGEPPYGAPPLGLLCLAAFAREKRPGKDRFLLVNEGLSKLSPPRWSRLMADFKPDLVAISALTPQARFLADRAALFKKIAPDTPVVVGGPHATAMGDTLLKTPGIDYIVRGEGELGFTGLLNALEKGEKYPEESISGLAFLRPDGSIRQNPHNKMLLDVNKLPFPAWDLVRFEDYYHSRRMTSTEIGGRYAYLMTSRGCPFSCIYCHDIFGSRYRAMHPEKVLEHMERLIEQHNVKDFEIVDDIFNLDRERVLKICRLIVERGLKIRFSFPNGLRCDLLDRELLTALRKAGAYSISFAVETADKDLQKKIHKNLDIEKVRQNIAIAAELGIFTWGFFMLGFPGETRQQMEKTVQFAIKSKLHGALFFLVIPFPGTPLAHQCLSESQALQASRDITYFFAQNSLSDLTAQKLKQFQKWAFVRFFLNPLRMARIGRDYPGGYGVLLKRTWFFFFHILLTRKRV